MLTYEDYQSTDHLQKTVSGSIPHVSIPDLDLRIEALRCANAVVGLGASLQETVERAHLYLKFLRGDDA